MPDPPSAPPNSATPPADPAVREFVATPERGEDALTADAREGAVERGAGTPELPSDGAEEDARAQRRELAKVWLAAGSALAAMVATSWYMVVRNGGQPPGGDMFGHAAAAEWLRTLPWWDWRGWSDWFYGGQAIGVNYPPLGHALMRFTHPVHGQLAAVAVGLLLLLPWGTLRLARAMDYKPRAQRVAVATVLVLIAASGGMHWVLSGFHHSWTFFGSWPAMIATVAGLFCAAWAARCRAAVACGIVAGLALLFNATVIPGVAVVCAVLLISSGASFGPALRWAATAGATALAVCAWWLVPFVAGWDRLVAYDVALATAWGDWNVWQLAVLALLGVATVWAARNGGAAAKRLAVAAAVGLLATLLAELSGYLRPERWLQLPILIAAVAVGHLLAVRPQRVPAPPARPAWVLLAIAGLIVFVIITVRLEVLPLAAWLMGRRQPWRTAGAFAWAGVLVFVPVVAHAANPLRHAQERGRPLDAVVQIAGEGAEGLVYADRLHTSSLGEPAVCQWDDPWLDTIETSGRIRPLAGLYRETSPAEEFLEAERGIRMGNRERPQEVRPHWSAARDDLGQVSFDRPVVADAFGARWHVACDSEGNAFATELQGALAQGVVVIAQASEESWHRAAVGWWIRLATAAPQDATSGELRQVPVLTPGEGSAYPLDRAAEGILVQPGADSLTVQAQDAGWTWIRVPWDPDWRSTAATPVRKGPLGHLVVWVEQGVTELRWAVPRSVDLAAAVTTGTAALLSIVLSLVNRRRRLFFTSDRRKPAAEALEAFARSLDGWILAARPRRHWFRRRAWADDGYTG